MTTLSIQPPYPIITDIDGQPLEDGYIWIGVANLPPIGNPIAVYWDAALTQAAALPIRTRGGYPVNSGTPARLYVGSDYSIQVQNKNGSVVYSAPAATERYGALIISSADISFLQAGANAVVRTAQSKMRDVVSVKDFGAVGDGVADDTAAIQAAINYAIYLANTRIGKVYIPQGKYKTTDTIHVGYGTSFTGLRVIGDGIKYNGETNFGGTTILPTFGDRPAFSMQGVRHSSIEDMTIIGVNQAFVVNNGLGSPACAVNDTNTSAWFGPNLGANAATRYAVYCGVAVDPYSGARPATSYPDVNYPNFLGAISQYNKNFSSAPRLKNVQIRGFVAAVAVQPCDADGNGDFLKLDKCEFSYNVYGVVVGNSQSRTVGVYGCDFNVTHTLFDTSTFGRQAGFIHGNIDSCSFGNTLNICNVGLGYGSLNFTSCYAENTWQIGALTTAAQNGIAKFVGCDLHLFMVRYPTNDYVAPRGTTLGHFSGGTGPVAFVGGVIRTDFGLILNSNMRVNITDTAMDTNFLRSDTSQLPDLTACPSAVRARFIGHSRRLIERPDSIYYRSGPRSIAGWDPTSGVFKIDNRRLSDVILQGRTKTSPREIDQLFNAADFNRPTIYASSTYPRYILNKATSPFTVSGISATFTDPYNAGTSTSAYPIGPGDYLWDNSTGLVWLVHSKAGAVCSAIALNGYTWTGSAYALIPSFTASSGQMQVAYTGTWVNNSYLFGNFTSGSADITNVGGHDNVWSSPQPQVNDYLIWSNSARCPYPEHIAKITAVDTATRTITLNRTATYSVSGAPIMVFYTP